MKKVFRSFLSGICFSLFGIGGLIIGMIIFPLIILMPLSAIRKRFIMTGIVRSIWRIFVKLMSAFRLISVDFTPLQAYNKLTGTIVVANHPSLIDVVLLISVFPNCVGIVKSALTRNIFMRAIVKHIYIINDTDPEILLKECTETLQQGFNLVVFPEGTRTVQSVDKIRLHRSVAHIAIRGNHPILPIHIQNNPPILGKNQPWHAMNEVPSHYTFIPQKMILPTLDDTKSPHQKAVLLTQQIKKAIFP